MKVNLELDFRKYRQIINRAEPLRFPQQTLDIRNPAKHNQANHTFEEIT